MQQVTDQLNLRKIDALQIVDNFQNPFRGTHECLFVARGSVLQRRIAAGTVGADVVEGPLRTRSLIHRSTLGGSIQPSRAHFCVCVVSTF